MCEIECNMEIEENSYRRRKNECAWAGNIRKRKRNLEAEYSMRNGVTVPAKLPPSEVSRNLISLYCIFFYKVRVGIL